MTSITRLTFLVASLSALLGCGDDTAPAPICTAGMSVACIGAGGCAGGQACNAEGTGFGECACGGFDAGRLDGGMSDARTSDTGAGDAGTMDTGTMDVGVMDTGAMDVGTMDAGAMDAGSDAGPSDAGFDVGPPPPVTFNCDPFTHMPCAGGTPRCTGVMVEEAVVFDCYAAGTRAVGAPCEGAVGFADNCEAGSICADVCHEICDGTEPGTACEVVGNCESTTLINEDYSVGVCF